MELDKKNIELWQQVQRTDSSYVKKVSVGKRSFSAIDAHYQLQIATQIWGSMGVKWGIRSNSETFNEFRVGQKLLGDVQVDLMLCRYTATFFYPDGEIPISAAVKVSYVSGGGKHILDDDYAKKVSTDALTKGLSKLGFSADVFMGVFDGNKYDGIEGNSDNGDGNDDGPLMMSAETKAILKKYLPIIKERFPDKFPMLEKNINANISEEKAKTLVKTCHSYTGIESKDLK